MVGMIVYVLFFYSFMDRFKKNTENKEFDDKF